MVVLFSRQQIGGSLAKLVYFSRESGGGELGGRLNFLKFETDRVEQLLQFMGQVKARYTAQEGAKIDELSVVATGGGAYKYYDRMKEVLGVEITREDEMECLIAGLADPRSARAWVLICLRLGFLHQ